MTTEGSPIAALVLQAQQGDTAAFAALVRRSERDVYNLAYSILGNPQEAQDMAQEVFLRIWQHLPSFRGDSAFTTWLYRVTANACLNRRRQLRRELGYVDDESLLDRLPTPQYDPLATTIRLQRQEYLWSLVDRLPEKYRLVILLFYRWQLSYDEIAEVLMVPLGTVKAHLSRARHALAKQLNLEMEKGNVVL